MREDRGGKQTKRYQEQSQPGAKSLWTKKKKKIAEVIQGAEAGGNEAGEFWVRGWGEKGLEEPWVLRLVPGFFET